MVSVTCQKVRLYSRMSSGFARYSHVSATFDDFLDSIDGSYCTFEGGDDSTQDGVYPDTQLGGYTGMFVYLQTVHSDLTDRKA